jgi:hypothetical protein
MRYVAVLGTASHGNVAKIVFHYFKDYLVSMGEPTTTRNWTLYQINRHFKKIIDMKKEYKKINPEINLFIDSGGFQIIVGYIKKHRIFEYIDTYHFLLKKFAKEIDYIFSLDIMNRAWDKETLIKFNDKSINDSINLIKQIPEIKDKQLFVVQTRTVPVFELWKELMDKHEVFKYYKRFSFGGLVGLKKETNAKFSHVIPFIFWLLQKSKENNGTIKHIHLLGQSSKLMIFTAIFLENYLAKKYNLNIEFTMDSSELMRFTKIEQKLPLLCKLDDYQYISKLSDLKYVLENHSMIDEIKKDPENYEHKIDLLTKRGKLENDDFVDFMCQNISNMINFAHELIDNKSKKDLTELFEYKVEKIKNLHPVFKQGRLAQEIYNNLQLIKEFDKWYENNDLESIEKRCFDILKTY